MDEKEINSFLERFPIADLWGIGRNHTKYLLSQGIDTALKLKRAPPKWIRQKMSVVGERIVSELNGHMAHEIEEASASKKMITVSRSFKEPKTENEEIESTISAFIERAAEKLRGEGRVTSQVLVFIKTNRFSEGDYYSNYHLVELEVACNYTPTFITAAKSALSKIYKPYLSYKKAGVCLLELSDPESFQPSFFKSSSSRQEQLMQTLDTLNKRYGKRTVSYGAVKQAAHTITQRQFLSPCYTTHWSDLPKVK